MGPFYKIAGPALALVFAAGPGFAQTGFAESAPAPATAEDMAVFEPYIGRFRSADHVGENSGTRFHYVIDYRWYDRNRTIVSYALELVVPSEDRTVEIGNGFYWLDRARDRIGVFGVFRDGRSGEGAMGEFDHSDHSRAVWINAIGPDGNPVEVHDAFELLGDGRWANRTHIREPGGEWREIGDDIYTRIEAAAPDAG